MGCGLWINRTGNAKSDSRLPGSGCAGAQPALGSLATAERRAHLQRDLKTLVEFVSLYCRRRHARADARPVALKHLDVGSLAGGSPQLCVSCEKLLQHALVKRATCPLNPKPVCKHCPVHCYHPTYRAQIREVMRFSGIRFAAAGRIKYLLHLFF